MAALSRLASVPAITAFNPKAAISFLRFSIIFPSPPIKIAIEDRFANPLKAKEMITTLRMEHESEIIFMWWIWPGGM